MRLKPVLFALLALIPCAEAVATYAGYREQVIISRDASVGYMLQPSQSVSLASGPLETNRFGMRSPEVVFPIGQAQERLIIAGDSIVNAANVGDAAIASTLVADQLDCGIDVLNVSAGGWAPGNLLGYFSSYGYFEAETIVVVFNSEDAAAKGAFPAKWEPHSFYQPPRSGLVAFVKRELISRIYPRMFPNTSQAGSGVSDMNALLAQASQEAGRVIVLWHPTQAETLAHAHAPVAIRDAAMAVSATFVELGYAGGDYVDRMHLGAAAQPAFAAQILQVLGMCGDTQSAPQIERVGHLQTGGTTNI
ncbi:MAG: hypothetical protein JKX69_03625 [Rhodobacteraceae bacterium]|nr:hypothetical protein [Paracoccaceae bacterium]